jgi:hypothetical protein
MTDTSREALIKAIKYELAEFAHNKGAVMDRDAWNKVYADRIQEKTGLEPNWAMECAQSADDAFEMGYDAADAADEELTYWDADE